MIPNVDNDSIVYLNGEFVRLGDAKISVLDRGFIFGDGIYEVVPFYRGKPFRMDGHLARLKRSLAAIRIEGAPDTQEWDALVRDLVKRSGLEDSLVYLQVTRGVAKREHGFPDNVSPTLFAMVSPFRRPGAQQRSQGMTAVGMPDERWLHCEIKSISLLGNVLAKQHATDAGADEVLQFRDGYLSEGSSSNIWVIKEGKMYAPPRSNLILEGIRYGLMEELAQETGTPFQARPITQDEVAAADELLVTSASKEVLPITQYNGKPVGSGRPGPVYAALRAAYDRAIDAL
ncbi:D-amino acid aminotransferase [Allopusillimonas soli]|uniref:D-amino acid aminotransferase n=1 Tax=Allopusillimonas soli TaxID=659016 RepID=A0A853FBB0_9BURK|nr:D-amino acid aminotransferase [Allopusillimonas soli]NYT38045.1 D-amino acid aminotransferase [Allopusillimonas soli]TEA73934.1 D-amino acid aminotransferase [Allopusillimonas soli]